MYTVLEQETEGTNLNITAGLPDGRAIIQRSSPLSLTEERGGRAPAGSNVSVTHSTRSASDMYTGCSLSW